MPQFQPRYIFDTELASYNLPDVNELPTIMNFVDAASSLIDEYCGRTDGDGNGSLVYTTYTERLLLPEARNVIRTMFKPLVAVTVATQAALALSGNLSYMYTGFQANTLVNPALGVLSPFLSASGRYGYGRRGRIGGGLDINSGINLLQVATWFGGPPAWTPIDCTAIDFDPRTGEIWIPAGIYLSQYTEIVLQYNSGYDPRDMPRAVKHATAAVVRNIIARGGGTSSLKSLQGGGVTAAFSDDYIDPSTQYMLRAYVNEIAY